MEKKEPRPHTKVAQSSLYTQTHTMPALHVASGAALTLCQYPYIYKVLLDLSTLSYP
jgi:hypothetical protein